MTDSPEGSDATSSAQSEPSVEAMDLVGNIKSNLATAQELNREIREQQAIASEVAQSLSALNGEIAALAVQAKADLSQLSEEVNASRNASQQAYKDAQSGIETLKQSIQTLTGDVTTKSVTLEQKLAEALSQIDASTATATQKLESLVVASDSSAQSAGTHQASSQASADAAGQILESLKQTAQAIATLKAEVDAHHVITRESAAAKQKFDEGATKAFEQFQAACETANTRNAAFEADASKFKEEIDRLIQHANTMVFGATTAGIATSFEKEVRLLDDRIRNATWAFVVGVGLLAASLTPLILHVLQSAPGQELNVGTILARSIFLIPSGWFTLHFARRIHANFELRQQYVHKFSLAATLEPFRKAAGERGDQAVADAWGQLVKNPANLMRRHQRLGDGPAEMASDLVNGTKKLLPSAKVSGEVSAG